MTPRALTFFPVLGCAKIPDHSPLLFSVTLVGAVAVTRFLSPIVTIVKKPGCSNDAPVTSNRALPGGRTAGSLTSRRAAPAKPTRIPAGQPCGYCGAGRGVSCTGRNQLNPADSS